MLKYHPRTFRTDTHQTAQKLSAFGVHTAELFHELSFWILFVVVHSLPPTLMGDLNSVIYLLPLCFNVYFSFILLFCRAFFFSFYLFCSLLTFRPIVADVVALYLRVVYDVPSTQHRLQTLPFWFDIVSLINGLTAPALCSLWANNKQFK